MSETWQDFEVECYNHLRNTYGRAARFEAYGQSDSTYPDILVISPKGFEFFIETKSSSAQCGQFVLIPDESRGVFNYSSRNHTQFFDCTQIIIDYMNENFETFINAGTAGEDICLNKEIFYNWIIEYYSSKGVKFFITKAYDYIIFPIEKFPEYFDVSCCYRMKKSGSTDPAKADFYEIQSLLDENGISGRLKTFGKELYLDTSSQNIDGVKLIGQSYTYMLRAGANGYYRIRRLSNTCNSNVIFQITLYRMHQAPQDLHYFENSL